MWESLGIVTAIKTCNTSVLPYLARIKHIANTTNNEIQILATHVFYHIWQELNTLQIQLMMKIQILATHLFYHIWEEWNTLQIQKKDENTNTCNRPLLPCLAKGPLLILIHLKLQMKMQVMRYIRIY